MNRTFSTNIFKATITIGLQKGYSAETFNEEEILQHLQLLQDKLITDKNIYLSANCYESILVLSGQMEPHLNLQFINYPKFPLPEATFKEAVEWLAIRLMKAFKQNRLVIQFHDAMVMLELSAAIDPKIKTNDEAGE